MQQPKKQGKKGPGTPPPPEEFRWKKGQSGNPVGRPRKEVCLTSLVKAELDAQAEHQGVLLTNADGTPKTWAHILASAIVRQAARGNPSALSQLWDRIEGKTKEVFEITDTKAPDLSKIPRDKLIAKLRKVTTD